MFNFTINFYLHNDPKQLREIFIYCYIRSGGDTLTLRTFQRVNPQYWDVKKQLVKRNHPSEMEINNYLIKYKEKIKKLINEMKSDNIDITFEEVKPLLKAKINGKKIKDFIQTYTEYIEYLKTKQEKNSITKFVTLLNHLQEFEQQHKMKITFNSINQLFFDKLYSYFDNNNLKVSTQNKLVSCLNSFMNYTYSREIHSNDKYKSIEKPKTTFSTQIALTMDELQRFETVTLPNHLDKARDLFLFSLYNGQRYSDTVRFDISDFKDGYWLIRQKKTKETVRIKLHYKSIQILSKYNYSLPKLSNQKLNDYLKEIGKLAKIDEPIKHYSRIGSKEIENIYYKYELITSHSARRTFVTLAKSKNIDSDLIKATTGHRTDKHLSTYVISNNLETESILNEIFN